MFLIAEINESKILTKQISCEWKHKFDDRKCNSNQQRNNNICPCERKNPKEHNARKKDYIWDPRCSCKNDKYLASTIDVSVITCEEITNAVDSVLKNSEFS